MNQYRIAARPQIKKKKKPAYSGPKTLPDGFPAAEGNEEDSLFHPVT